MVISLKTQDQADILDKMGQIEHEIMTTSQTHQTYNESLGNVYENDTILLFTIVKLWFMYRSLLHIT